MREESEENVNTPFETNRNEKAVLAGRKERKTSSKVRFADLPEDGCVGESRVCQVQAKYGKDSVFLDLDDMDSTTGNWDMYGMDDQKRYPEPQAAFFDRAADGLGRREAMYAFLGVFGGAGIVTWGALGSKQAKLPITVGPQEPPAKGPGGKI